MMTEQLEMTFQSGKRVACGSSRPHHRTTILTTTRKTYDQVRNLQVGEEARVEYVNDIISSAKGGQSINHHPIRRSALLARQIKGGFNRVKVRSEQGLALNCIIVGDLTGEEDACSGFITVRRSFAPAV